MSEHTEGRNTSTYQQCRNCGHDIVLATSAATGDLTWFHAGGGTDCPQPPGTRAEPMELEDAS